MPRTTPERDRVKPQRGQTRENLRKPKQQANVAVIATVPQAHHHYSTCSLVQPLCPCRPGPPLPPSPSHPPPEAAPAQPLPAPPPPPLTQPSPPPSLVPLRTSGRSPRHLAHPPLSLALPPIRSSPPLTQQTQPLYTPSIRAQFILDLLLLLGMVVFYVCCDHVLCLLWRCKA